MKQKKPKHKRKKKLTKWEVKFIEEYGIEEYQVALEFIPELKTSPQFFEVVMQQIRLYKMPLTPGLKHLYDKFCDSHPIDDEEV